MSLTGRPMRVPAFTEMAHANQTAEACRRLRERTVVCDDVLLPRQVANVFGSALFRRIRCVRVKPERTCDPCANR